MQFTGHQTYSTMHYKTEWPVAVNYVSSFQQQSVLHHLWADFFRSQLCS